MGLLKLATDIQGIDFYDYRDSDYYGKYKYRVRFSIEGVRYAMYEKNFDGLMKRYNTITGWKKIKDADRPVVTENLEALGKFIDFRNMLKENNNGVVRIECSKISIFGNDLALLKIEDKDYKQPKAIPYAIRRNISDLGEEIFTLGFPRNDNDIVYGKGYLSAQTGYEGDSSSYQIQISANPGYSGAPIFNANGELIGVISTRQKLAEGVAFAVKSTEIIDVVNELKKNEKTKNINIKLQKYTTGQSANRKAQIDNLKNFMYSVRSFN